MLERIETWFLAVHKGRFVPDDGILELKNQVSKGTCFGVNLTFRNFLQKFKAKGRVLPHILLQDSM
jgi:hypothetical protein